MDVICNKIKKVQKWHWWQYWNILGKLSKLSVFLLLLDITTILAEPEQIVQTASKDKE